MHWGKPDTWAYFSVPVAVNQKYEIFAFKKVDGIKFFLSIQLSKQFHKLLIQATLLIKKALALQYIDPAQENTGTH